MLRRGEEIKAIKGQQPDSKGPRAGVFGATSPPEVGVRPKRDCVSIRITVIGQHIQDYAVLALVTSRSSTALGTPADEEVTAACHAIAAAPSLFLVPWIPSPRGGGCLPAFLEILGALSGITPPPQWGQAKSGLGFFGKNICKQNFHFAPEKLVARSGQYPSGTM